MVDNEEVNQLTLDVTYADDDMLQLECNVNCHQWSGRARVYAPNHSIRDFAANLQQFIDTLQGESACEFGADTGVGLVGLRFYCVDRAGHIGCRVRLASDRETCPSEKEIWRLSIEIPVEAASILRFLRQLLRLEENRAGQAVLHCGSY